MGMIILLFYVIPYMVVSAIIMLITVKYIKRIWIRGIVAAALFLIPIYDIIITNILGVYYCATTPKAFIKETVEYPQSIYFEDNVRPFEDANINWIKGRFVDGVHIKTLALNLPDGNVTVFSFNENFSELKEYEETEKELDKAMGICDTLEKEVRKKLEDGIIKYKSDEHSRYINKIDIQKESIFKLMNKSKEIRNKMIIQTTTTKDKIPETNYTAKFDEIKLDKFSSNFLIATEFKLINNKTSEIIAYKREYHNYYYNMFPNLSTGGKINWKSFCDCEKLDKEIGVIFLDEYL